MCSIVGMGFQRDHTVYDKRMVHKIIDKLLISGMSRGRTATGLCYTSNEEITIVKNKIEATNFIDTDFYKNAQKKYACFEKYASKQLLSVIGHCRQKTKGTELNNKNNHPISYENVVGVHNGVITNDDEQFKKYKDVLSRKAQVDSEIIFALVNHFVTLTESIPKGIQKACENLHGSYACAMIHRHQPYILWLFRSSAPCTIYHYKDKGIIIFASLPSFIIDATCEHDLGLYEEISLSSYEGIGLDLLKNKYQRMDLKNA